MRIEKAPTGGNFLKAENVKSLRITKLRIEDEGEFVLFKSKDGQEQEKISVGISYEGKRDGDPDSWTLNNKSRNAMIDIFGEDTAKWVGKDVEIKLNGEGEYEHVMVDTMRTKA